MIAILIIFFQAILYEESQSQLKKSMELDTKESELENLQLKLAHVNLDTAELDSMAKDNDNQMLGCDDFYCVAHVQSHLYNSFARTCSPHRNF